MSSQPGVREATTGHNLRRCGTDSMDRTDKGERRPSFGPKDSLWPSERRSHFRETVKITSYGQKQAVAEQQEDKPGLCGVGSRRWSLTEWQLQLAPVASQSLRIVISGRDLSFQA